MRYQDSRENGKQHRYNQYSYRPYDATGNQKIIKGKINNTYKPQSLLQMYYIAITIL